jgi:hypothetical protein
LDKAARATTVSALLAAMAAIFVSGNALADGWYHSYSDPSYDVAYANVDITKIESYKLGTDVAIELTVRGAIEDSIEIAYWIYFGQPGSESSFYYSNGTSTVHYHGGGSGASAVSISGSTLTTIIEQANAGPESAFDIFGRATYDPTGHSAQADWAGPMPGAFILATSPAGMTLKPGDAFTVVGQVQTISTGEPISRLFINMTMRRLGNVVPIFVIPTQSGIDGFFLYQDVDIPPNAADGQYEIRFTSQPGIQPLTIQITVKKPVESLSPVLQWCIILLVIVVIVVIVLLIMRKKMAVPMEEPQQYPSPQQPDRQKPLGQ